MQSQVIASLISEELADWTWNDKWQRNVLLAVCVDVGKYVHCFCERAMNEICITALTPPQFPRGVTGTCRISYQILLSFPWKLGEYCCHGWPYCVVRSDGVAISSLLHACPCGILGTGVGQNSASAVDDCQQNNPRHRRLFERVLR